MKTLKIAPIALLLMIAVLTSCNNSTSSTNADNDKNKDATQDMIDPDHSPEHALDWPGVYEGTLPCADCPGIKTTISINVDGTFKKKEVYEGKKESFDSDGNLKWDSTGSIISLIPLSANSLTSKYKVAENRLIALDSEGKIVEGELARNYILLKTK